MQDFNKEVGIGSKSQDLLGDVRMSRRISSSEAGEKLSNLGVFGSAGKSFAITLLGNEERMIDILVGAYGRSL